MIKRRFFKIEHGDKDEVASAASSSSDSDSEIEPQASEEEEEDSADNGVSVSLEEQEDAAESNSTSSGYQSEDSSDNVDNSHFSPTGLLFLSPLPPKMVKKNQISFCTFSR